MHKRMIALIATLAAAPLTLTACSASSADVASENLSTAADNFEVNRRIVFYNGITDQYLLEIRGYCSLGNNDSERSLSVTCKTGKGEFKKHFLGLSDNVTFIVEQLEPARVSSDRYRVIFKPQTMLPDIDIKVNTTDQAPGK
jgi:hypothetical protein